jgi:hypothetical protein
MQSEIEVTEADRGAARRIYLAYRKSDLPDEGAKEAAHYRIATEQRIAEWLRARAAGQSDLNQHADTHLIADVILSGAYKESDRG